ncbi:MAG: hypothetical protein K2Y39_22630 [Candidatus Obscuribacterales bacterium]|nr:hypothetical protein [Candidatus Obscuribacterales bacterium]
MSNFRALTFSFVFISITLVAPQGQALAAGVASSNDAKPATLLKKSYDQMVASEFREAIDTQIQAVKADKNNIDARRYLSYSLLKIGAAEEAIEQLNILLTMTKATPVDMLMCGEACLQAGKLKAAEQWFKKALVADPQLACAKVGLANVAAAKKRVATALEDANNSSDEALADEPQTTYQLGLHQAEDAVIAYTVRAAGAQDTQSYASETARQLRNAAANQQVASAQSTALSSVQNLSNNQAINNWANFKGIQKR